MRKLILGMLVALMAVSCDQYKKKIEHLEFQRDSVQHEKDLVVQERDSFLETLSEIESNFAAIKELELGIIDHNQEGNKNNKARIQEDMQIITNKLQENRERISQLENDLKRSQGQTAHFRNLVTTLQKNLELKEQEITELKQQVEERDVKIAALSTRIVSLNSSKDSLSTVSAKQIAAIKAQEDEINAGWYVIGKKKEVNDKGLKEGQLKKARLDRGKFKRIDVREFKEIDLGSRKAKLYSSHPAALYRLEQKSDKNLVLKITDHRSFWANTKYLIVQIN